MESGNRVKARIDWCNSGSVLDSVSLEYHIDDDYAIAAALVKFIGPNIVAPGDVFKVIEE